MGDALIKSRDSRPVHAMRGRSSGLASTVSDIKKAWPNATVKDGFAIYGHEVRSGKAKVEKWIKGLEL